MKIACEASDGVGTAISSVEIEIRLEVDLCEEGRTALMRDRDLESGGRVFGVGSSEGVVWLGAHAKIQSRYRETGAWGDRGEFEDFGSSVRIW